METVWGVRLMYSNAEGVARDPTLFWSTIRSTRGQDPIRFMAVINNALMLRGLVNTELHAELEAEFASGSLREILEVHRTKFDGGVFLFNRPAQLLAMKLLMGVERSDHDENELFTTVGDILLLANDFVESPEDLWDRDPDLISLLAEFAPIWELNNPRNIFQLFVRAFLILTEHVPEHDQMRMLLIESPFGAAPPELLIDGLRLDDYLALVFGIYTNVRDSVLGQKTCIIGMDQFYRVTTIPHEGIDSFLQRRSGDLATFRTELNLHADDAETFVRCVENGAVAMDASVIKQRPIFVAADGRHSILDCRFLMELVSTTIYWSIFDGLDKKGRDLFSIFWGECFEAFVVRELRFFYPTADNLLRSEVPMENGAIDALVDYGDFILCFEIKSGLLAKNPRLMRDPDILRQELRKKFVEPKGVGQLAKAAKAIAKGEVQTIRPDCRIYPILIVDEPVLQCFAANTYLDEQFDALYPDRPGNVAPLAVMLIDELEELLPYVNSGALTWREVLDARSTEKGVVPDPFHSTLVSVRAKKNVTFQKNDFLSEEGARIGKLILERYHFDKMPAG